VKFSGEKLKFAGEKKQFMGRGGYGGWRFGGQRDRVLRLRDGAVGWNAAVAIDEDETAVEAACRDGFRRVGDRGGHSVGQSPKVVVDNRDDRGAVSREQATGADGLVPDGVRDIGTHPPLGEDEGPLLTCVSMCNVTGCGLLLTRVLR
jgi:hypothetical protein